MRYLLAFAVSALLAPLGLLATAFALAPAPVPAEYWVRQAMVIKRDIARQHRGQRKAFVVGGSSALFAIDTRLLTEAFGVPFLNLSTHAGLPLRVHLAEAARVAARGDVVILALEPQYYSCAPATLWYMRNAIAWQGEAWRERPLLERSLAFRALGPGFIGELAGARLAQLLSPGAIRDRLDALDDAATLRQFARAVRPHRFGYTAANFDSLGNIRMTEGALDSRIDAYLPVVVFALCPAAGATLREFVERQERAGVAVRFAHSPLIAAPGDTQQGVFERELSGIAPLLDSRPEVTFERTLFFDNYLHLNAEGRRRHTAALAAAIRRDPALVAHLQAPSR